MSDKPKLYHIVAKNKQNIIGIDNSIPWHCPEDFKFFRNMTIGNVVMMGRKTFESINKKVLPDRLNIVISTTLQSGDYNGAKIVPNIEEALTIANQFDFATLDGKRKTLNPMIFIIGGGQLYLDTKDLVNGKFVSDIIHQTPKIPTNGVIEYVDALKTSNGYDRVGFVNIEPAYISIDVVNDGKVYMDGVEYFGEDIGRIFIGLSVSESLKKAGLWNEEMSTIEEDEYLLEYVKNRAIERQSRHLLDENHLYSVLLERAMRNYIKHILQFDRLRGSSVISKFDDGSFNNLLY